MTERIELRLDVSDMSSMIDAVGPALAAMDADAQGRFVARFNALVEASQAVDVQMVDGVARAVPTPAMRALFSAEGQAA